jgi:DNA-binding protein H-NS
MSKTYAEIAKQIEVLKRDAEKARRKEVVGVISRIREAIDAYGLTAADLGFGGGSSSRVKPAANKPAPAKKTRGPRAAKAAKAPAEVKYRNEAGGTWGGRGKRPQWLRDALAAGKQLSDFEVK